MSFNRQKSKFVYELSNMYTLLAWCEPPRMDSVRNIPGQLFIFVCGGICPHIFFHIFTMLPAIILSFYIYIITMIKNIANRIYALSSQAISRLD